MPKGSGSSGIQTDFNGLEARAALQVFAEGGAKVKNNQYEFKLTIRARPIFPLKAGPTDEIKIRYVDNSKYITIYAPGEVKDPPMKLVKEVVTGAVAKWKGEAPPAFTLTETKYYVDKVLMPIASQYWDEILPKVADVSDPVVHGTLSSLERTEHSEVDTAGRVRHRVVVPDAPEYADKLSEYAMHVFDPRGA